MKKIIRKIGIIGTIATISVCSYHLGTMKEKIIEKPVEVEVIPGGYINTRSYDFYNNYVDMRKVVDFSASNDGLQIILEDGNGYWWER